MTDPSTPLAEVLASLDLEPLDADLFLGHPGEGHGSLFGGMVAAQSVVAACRTVAPERRIHSLHSYFLRPGRHDAPLRFVVDRIRDGKTFTTRRVVAHQAGEAIFSMVITASRETSSTSAGVMVGGSVPGGLRSACAGCPDRPGSPGREA